VVFQGLGRTDNIMNRHSAGLRVINTDTILDCHCFTLYPGWITDWAFYSMAGSFSANPVDVVPILVRKDHILAAAF
jgi:hypothetical protein